MTASSDERIGGVPRLHLVTDDRVLRSRAFLRSAADLMHTHGSRIALHLRGPGLTGLELFSAAVACCEIASRTGSIVLVNDRVDVALCSRSAGVQLGGRSLPISVARGLAGDRLLLGASVHSPEDAIRSFGEGADFVLAGTLFSTPSHPGLVPSGLDWIGSLPAVGLPIIGIGGITADRVADVVGAGADGVAVIRAVWDAPDASAAAARLLEALAAAGVGRIRENREGK